MALNSNNIRQLLSSDFACNKVFLGVYPIDLVPQDFLTPSAVVINTDPHDRPGEHWISIFFHSKNSASFFDSFGKTPTFYKIDLIFPKIIWKFNEKRLQSSFSQTCGLYCCLFIKFLARNLQLSAFYDNFSENFLKNDMILLSFFEKFNNFLVNKR